MKLRPHLILALGAVLLFAGRAYAAEPIHFHGQLRTRDDRPLRGLHQVNFKFYEDSSLIGIPLSSETRTVVANSEGYYDIELNLGSRERLLRDRKVLYVAAETREAAGDIVEKTVITSIPQGIWFNCNPDNGPGACDNGTTINTESAIGKIAAGHFSYILNADNWWGSQAELTAYADKANTSGVKIIWYLGSDFSIYLSSKSFPLISNDTELPTSFCSGCSNSSFTTALIKFVSAFPATAGYLIDDEEIQDAAGGFPVGSAGKKAAATDGKDIAALAKLIRAADAKHPIFGTEDYLDVPDASEAELSAYYSYIPDGTLNYYGTDYYPVGSFDGMLTNAQLTSDQKADQNWLDSIATSKDAAGTFEDLQAFNWTDSGEGGCPSSSCAFPTVAQLQDMLTGAATSTHTPAQIFWWEYTDVVYNNQWNNLLTATNPQ